MTTLLIDNYDSFTFNLYQQIARISGREPIVVTNDEVTIEQIKELPITNVVISPGPGRPDVPRDFGVCGEVLTEIRLPLLGVCLGHQGLASCFGGKIAHAPEPVHGRLSEIVHDGSGLFENIPDRFSAVRYHSLAVQDDLPEVLECIASADDGVVMGIRHKLFPFWGIQFHPESVCTEYGDRLIENFLRLSRRYTAGPGERPMAPRKPATATRVPRGGSRFEATFRKLDRFPDPEAVFRHKYADKSEAFWLDSSMIVPGRSRFSFMGAADGPGGYSVSYKVEERLLAIKKGNSVTYRHESIFDFLERSLQQNLRDEPALPFDFAGGFAGYFGYELKAECGASAAHVSKHPDAAFVFADRFLAFDHKEHTVYLVAQTENDRASAVRWFDDMERELDRVPELPAVERNEPPVDPVFTMDRSRETYLNDIAVCLKKIVDGESHEICLTNQLYAEPVRSPLEVYGVLRKVNPAPFAAYLKFGTMSILCSSPEHFIHVDRGRWVTSKPIKGTVGRDNDPERDRLKKNALENSVKDRAENLMIVDLVRNDLGRVCEIGSVVVPELMQVETYATVHQMVSTVRGRLRGDKSVVDCIRATFPGGSMTGAPKIRAMEIIDELEGRARGVYSGSIGLLGLNGTADMNIVIRTAVAAPESTSVGTGGAIVALSDPEAEFDETLVKAEVLIRAIELAAGGSSGSSSVLYWEPHSVKTGKAKDSLAGTGTP